MNDASHALVEQLGDGPTVVYFLPHGAEPVNLDMVIVRGLRVSDDLEEEFGTHQRDEQQQECELVIPQPFEPHMHGHFGIAKYGQPVFSVREVRSVTEAFVTVLVERSLVQRLRKRGQG